MASGKSPRYRALATIWKARSRRTSQNFYQKIPSFCRLPAKAEVICLFFHDHMQLWSSRFVRNLRRRLSEPALQE